MKIGEKIIHLESVDSTNNYIANLVKQGEIRLGTVVLADEQFAGKGQRGAEWSVKPGENLTFSFFLDNVNLSVENQFVLTQLVSLSLIELLQRLGVETKIKWPNDIYVNNEKIAGVLIENQLKQQHIKSSIIGVGLNVNQETFDGFTATSIIKQTGVRKVPMEVLFSFIDSFNLIVEEYSLQSKEELKKRYMKSLYLLNSESKFEDSIGVFTGKIIDVLSSGKLVVDKGHETSEYDLKEIKFLS